MQSKAKGKGNLSVLMDYAGRRRVLTYLSWVLSAVSAHRSERKFCRGTGKSFRVRMVGGRQRAHFHARLLRGAHVLARRGVPRGGQYAQGDNAPYRDAPRRVYEQPRQRVYEQPRQRQGAPYRQRIERGDGNLSRAPAPRHGGRVRNARRDDRSFVRV